VILADTSIWINHLRGVEAGLSPLLEDDLVLIHPFILGELSLGHLRQRSRLLHDLQLLSGLSPATDMEVLDWVEKRRLFGKGIGWVDAHLLLACLLENVEFWTGDKNLAKTGRTVGVRIFPPG
jgi:predicted nucleic acid-binding protein